MPKPLLFSLLIASLIGNLGAGYMLLIQRRNGDLTTTPSRQRSTQSVAAIKPPSSADDRALPFWRQLPAEDLPALARTLRRAGFPPFAVEAIISEHANARMWATREELGFKLDRATYWQANPLTSADLIQSLQRLFNERDEHIIAALGAESEYQANRLKQKFRSMEFLPLQQLDALDRIERDYEAIRTENPGLAFLSIGARSPEQDLLQQERLADIAAALGPDGFFEYQLRHSSLAFGLRNIGLNEVEFRHLFTAASAIVNLTGNSNDLANVPWASRNTPEVRQAFTTQIAAGLPPDRAAEIVQLMDTTASAENAFVRRIGQPLTSAAQLVAFREEVKSLTQSTTSEDPATVRLRRSQIRAKLESLFGADALALYTAHRAGRWLAEID